MELSYHNPVRRLRTHVVRSPQERVNLIENQVLFSSHGPELMRLRQLVITEMLNGARDFDDEGQITAVYNWVRNNIRYVPDPVALDLYPSALSVYALGGGDCDCHVILLCAALATIGFTTGCRVIETKESGWHIYAIAFFPRDNPDQEIPLDTTWPESKGPGDEYPPEDCLFRDSWIFEMRGR